ncbi:MAG: ferrochelatase [Planctomycetota bacterium]
MRTEWILVNLGTPEAPTAEAVRAFLGEFLSDPMVVDFPQWLWRPILHGIVLRTRPPKVAEAYEAIWTPDGSPLAAATRRMVERAGELLGGRARVSLAYRYGKERVDRVVERALERADQVVVTHLFPQPTASSSGTVEVLVRDTAKRLGAEERVRLAPLAPDADGYVAALAERVREAEARFEDGRADHLVVSFHGIPERVDKREGSTYRGACERTYAALVAALERPADTATLAFQSKFGPGAWLSPATDQVLVERARAGLASVLIATPGFLTPGLETIEELGMRGREDFLAAGGRELRLADPPGDHPRCLRAMAESAGL